MKRYIFNLGVSFSGVIAGLFGFILNVLQKDLWGFIFCAVLVNINLFFLIYYVIKITEKGKL